VQTFTYRPHPHVAHRKKTGAPTVAKSLAASPSFNMRLAAWGTAKFGSMPAFYLFVIYGALGAVFTAEQVTLLYWSNWVQLWSLPLIAVGTAVTAIGLNAMSKRQFDDVEALLHGQGQIAEHLAAQDQLLAKVARKLEVDADPAAGGAR
jgi:hypothetical protein